MLAPNKMHIIPGFIVEIGHSDMETTRWTNIWSPVHVCLHDDLFSYIYRSPQSCWVQRILPNKTRQNSEDSDHDKRISTQVFYPIYNSPCILEWIPFTWLKVFAGKPHVTNRGC